jgi:cytidylate kinase
MGSVVFPNARWKVFLDAPPQERARRRLQDFRRQGRNVTEAEVLEEIEVRDRLDSTRKDAPLVRSPDARYIDTGGMSSDQVIETILQMVRAKAHSEPS